MLFLTSWIIDLVNKWRSVGRLQASLSNDEIQLMLTGFEWDIGKTITKIYKDLCCALSIANDGNL